MEKYKKLLNKFSTACEWASIREYKEVTDFIMARNAKPDQINTGESHGVMVEVLYAGQISYAGTSDLTDEGIEKAFHKALNFAIKTKQNNLCDFDDSIRPANQGEHQTETKIPFEDVSLAEPQSNSVDITKALKVSDEIIEASAWAMLTKTNINYISTNGANWSQEFCIVSKDFSATASRDNENQTRSYGMNGRQLGLEDIDMTLLLKEAKRVGSQAVELLDAEECPTDQLDLIMAPDQLYLQVHESIGHPLELDRILGDERNYAGWSFIGPDDFGKRQYGSNLLNVTFDPTLTSEMASYTFDDNGVKASKEYLIKDGVLLRGIGGIESQTRSNIPGVSCARSCDWNRPPMDRMGNINIEPGETSIEDMIKGVKKGIIMYTNRSWSIDDYRNKFQFGCEYAKLIEDGKITKTLKNPNYRGVTDSFWMNLDKVGDQSTYEIWGSPYCGKGEPNQVIRVGHAIPTCKFKNIEVFGGA